MRKVGGRVLAISVDPPDKAQRVVANNRLPFAVLCDETLAVTRAYGLVHAGGAPDGKDIPIPAHFLIDSDGRIVWEHVAKRIQDRPAPSAVIEAVRTHFAK